MNHHDSPYIITNLLLKQHLGIPTRSITASAELPEKTRFDSPKIRRELWELEARGIYLSNLIYRFIYLILSYLIYLYILSIFIYI